MDWLLGVVGVLAGGGVAATWVYRTANRDAIEKLEQARAEAAGLKAAAEHDRKAAIHLAEAEAREQALETKGAAAQALDRAIEQVSRREELIVKREAQLEADAPLLTGRLEVLSAKETELAARTEAAAKLRSEAGQVVAEARTLVETTAGATAQTVKQQLADGWIEEARAQAAHDVRAVDQNPSDPEWTRQAQRIMGIAINRYQGHYLTERLLSNIALPPGMAELLSKDESSLLHALEAGSGVKLELAETGEKVRIDSGDGVAREIARRALHRLIKGTAPKEAEKDPEKWVRAIGVHLDREIADLGKKAFSELEIPKAHPDIMKLVGQLNYRTSYTQNQWKHALEAAFLGGMMAAELRLDVKIARRAALMHDIGKALTHEIDGSHAVIGADYARRLGETEIVANAIGAHHADEPPNSVYAHLVAAADAMSGARPGARREQTESYSTRLEDLERIGNSFRGVEHAVAVQGGREIRVYVRERDVTDLRAVEMSGEIARKISEDMVFPGQIKVTVIRTIEAIATAN